MTKQMKRRVNTRYSVIMRWLRWRRIPNHDKSRHQFCFSCQIYFLWGKLLDKPLHWVFEPRDHEFRECSALHHCYSNHAVTGCLVWRKQLFQVQSIIISVSDRFFVFREDSRTIVDIKVDCPWAKGVLLKACDSSVCRRNRDGKVLFPAHTLTSNFSDYRYIPHQKSLLTTFLECFSLAFSRIPRGTSLHVSPIKTCISLPEMCKCVQLLNTFLSE